MNPVRMRVLGSVGCLLALWAASASAELSNQGMLDSVITEFSTRAKGWQTVMMDAASWLFWTLGTISLAWTGGMMVLRKADLAEFFAEFIRFILFFGFFLWLLRNGPEFAKSIIDSMQQMGAKAADLSKATPSGIVDIGFDIWHQTVQHLTGWSSVNSLVGVMLSGAILLLLAAVAVNMLLLLISGWVLMYVGIFFLGFGGSRWTSDIAISYYKTVLGLAVQLLTMALLVGIGNDLLKSFYVKLTPGNPNFEELSVILVFCLALLMLSSKIPAMVAGIITGGSGAGSDLGSFGPGAVMGAAMGAAGAASAAASMAGSALSSGAAHAGGGAQALLAAYSQVSAAGSDAGGMADVAGGGCANAFADMDRGKGSEVSADSGSEGRGARDGSGQAQPGAAGSSQGEGLLGRAAATAAGTADPLAQGALAVGKAKITRLREGALDRMVPTAGGKRAPAIKRAGGPASLGASASGHGPGQAAGPLAAEIQAFVQRDSRNP